VLKPVAHDRNVVPERPEADIYLTPSNLAEGAAAPSPGRHFCWKTSLATEIAVIALGQPA
jgi:hypothetical protein